MDKRTHSSLRSIPLIEKTRYWYGLLMMYGANPLGAKDFDTIRADIRRYEDVLGKYAHKPLANARALEIGFGQHPFRLFWMSAMGCENYGIDLDAPVLNLRASQLVDVYRRNGLERFAKTLVRVALFDRRVWREFSKRVEQEIGVAFRFPVDRLIVGSASNKEIWDRIGGNFDLIYSEDVFEHIPEDDLRKIVELMHSRLARDGVAVIAPLIFTGIAGGHDLEWYADKVDQDIPRRGEPWEHLRANRYPADTYLNRLRRADYRKLFSPHFEILEEIVVWPELGRQYLTPEARQELQDYDEEDLFSNKVIFVLKSR